MRPFQYLLDLGTTPTTWTWVGAKSSATIFTDYTEAQAYLVAQPQLTRNVTPTPY